MNCKDTVKVLVIAFILCGLNFAFAQAPSFNYPAGENYTVGTSINPLAPTTEGGAVPAAYYGLVTTFAGNGTIGVANGAGPLANFSSPIGIAIDGSGNLYVTDYYLHGIPYDNDEIRKITSSGQVTTLAGNTAQGFQNGQGTAASFFAPSGTAVDANGNVYVADVANNVIRKITPSGFVSTFAGTGVSGADDGAANKATFSSPAAISIDASGNLYVADYSNNMIRKITPAGVVSTLAGGGAGSSTNDLGTNASFKNPSGVAVDQAGNVYVADVGNNLIRKITPAGLVSTFAGNGSQGSANGAASVASFFRPTGVAVDKAGNVYVADAGYGLIREIKTNGQVVTLAGSGTPGSANGYRTNASFNDPEGLAIDADGNIYVGDKGNNIIRKIINTGYTISPGLPAGLNFDATSGIITGKPTSPSPTTIYTVTGYNSFGSSTAQVTITVTGAAGITPVAPPVINYLPPPIYKVNLTITSLAPANSGGVVPAAVYGGTSINAGTGVPALIDNTNPTLAAFNAPNGIAVDALGNVYVADAGNNTIRMINKNGIVTTIAGNGTSGSSDGNGSSARFNRPEGIAVDGARNVYVADAGNKIIRKISPTGQTSTFASGFNDPTGVAVDGVGNIYVVDAGDNVIKKITSAGTVSVFAGNGSIGSQNGVGTAASFSLPIGIAIDAAGYLYVTDSGDNLIRKITPGGLVSTIAGSGTQGSADGSGSAASFKSPVGITVDDIGNLYVGDAGNDLIRKITPSGVVSTLSGTPGQPGRTGNFFNDPSGVGIDPNGNLFVADLVNNIIKEVSTSGYTISPGLPPGLNFDGKTGTISGTPTAPSPQTNYTVTAYNTGGSNSCIVTITVQNPIIIVTTPPNISYVTPQNYVVNTAILPLQPANIGGAVPATIYGKVSSFAGSGAQGAANGAGAAAGFKTLHGAVTDLVGNVYICDNNSIREITPSGTVTTLAGSGAVGALNGQGNAASFNQPLALTVDQSGNVFIADTKNQVIRKVTQAGVVTMFAGLTGNAGSANGPAATAQFNAPSGITIDGNGNIYIADSGNNSIRKISTSGQVTTLASGLNNLGSISADQEGNIYAVDASDNLIKKISPAGQVSTFASGFNAPSGVSVDVAENLYVADSGNNLIKKISPSGAVSVLAGNGSAGSTNGDLTQASFNSPFGIAADIFGNVYVADGENIIVRKIVTTGYTISQPLPAGLTFNGATGTISGTPTVISPTTIYTVTAYNTGGTNSTQISITVSIGTIPPVPKPDISYTPGIVIDTVRIPVKPMVPVNSGGILPANTFGLTTTIAGTGNPGIANGDTTSASFNQPFGVATDTKGNIYVVDHLNNLIRKITPDGVVTTLAGSGVIGHQDGMSTAASFNNPTGIAVDVAGNVYVADVSNNLIRKITPAGSVTTLAGSGGNGSANGDGPVATFSNPSGLAVDAAGNIYVADLSNNLIRKITPGGVVSTLAGSGLSGNADGTGANATFNQPYGLTVDLQGNIYVADLGNDEIRKVTQAGVVTTVAGTGKAGKVDGIGTSASFNQPFGIAIDENGNLYVADTGNEEIREITPSGSVTTVAGNGLRGSNNGVGSQTTFYQPTGVVSDGAGDVYIADEFNHEIRRVVVISNYTIDKPLPPGLTFNRSNGTISGTPTAPFPATTYKITAQNEGGSNSTYVTISINPAPLIQQVITFGPLPTKVYGDPDFDPGATSNNTAIPIPITYTSSNTTAATIVGGMIHITGTGTTTITANQAGDDTAYIAAAPVSQTFIITPAPLIGTVADTTRPYGIANPKFTVHFSGFVYTDSPASLITQPVVTTSAVPSSPIGTYPITANGDVSPNYTITYNSGTLTITPVPTMIKPPNTFTPNDDQHNDFWVIQSIEDFPDCTVQVFNRYGGLVFQSRGYTTPWDGKTNGRPVPSGTYYYIINPKSGLQQIAGSVTILR